MKKLIECSKCKALHDPYHYHCPNCGKDNDEIPLNKKYLNMIFLSDYKEFLLLLTGMLGLLLFSLIGSIAFESFHVQIELRSSIVTLIAYVLTFAIMCCVIASDYVPFLNQFKKSIKNYKLLLLSLGGGAFIIAFSIGYSAILRACWADYRSSYNESQIETLVKAWPAITFFAICIFGPIVEELAYRSGLFSILRKRNRVLAYVVAAIIFAAMHSVNGLLSKSNPLVELANFPLYLIPAFTLCALYEYGGLTSSVYAHVLNNLVSFIVIVATK